MCSSDLSLSVNLQRHTISPIIDNAVSAAKNTAITALDVAETPFCDKKINVTALSSVYCNKLFL